MDTREMAVKVVEAQIELDRTNGKLEDLKRTIRGLVEQKSNMRKYLRDELPLIVEYDGETWILEATRCNLSVHKIRSV